MGVSISAPFVRIFYAHYRRGEAPLRYLVLLHFAHHIAANGEQIGIVTSVVYF